MIIENINFNRLGRDVTSNVITPPFLLLTTTRNESGTIEFRQLHATKSYYNLLAINQGTLQWSDTNTSELVNMNCDINYIDVDGVVSVTGVGGVILAGVPGGVEWVSNESNHYFGLSATGNKIYAVPSAYSGGSYSLYDSGLGWYTPVNKFSQYQPAPVYEGEESDYGSANISVFDLIEKSDGTVIAYRKHLTNPCFSVGTYTSDLKTASPTITITNSVATFSVEQVNDGIGAGDEIIYGSNKAYLYSKVNGNKAIWNVVDNIGEPVPNCSPTLVTSIKRVFNYLADSLVYNESPLSGVGAKLGSNNFFLTNVMPTLQCYNDHKTFGTNYDNKPVICSGYITRNYGLTDEKGGKYGAVLNISTPYDTFTHCNTRQRTIGIPDSGYCLSVNNSTSAIGYFDSVNTVIEGIEISGSAKDGLFFIGSTVILTVPDAILIPTYHKMKVIQCLVYNKGDYGVRFVNKFTNTTHYNRYIWNGSIWNCIIFGQNQANVWARVMHLDVYQSVLYGGTCGIFKDYNFGQFYRYNVFDGHIEDLSGSGSKASNETTFACRGRDNWFGTLSATSVTSKLTDATEDVFADHVNGNFLIPDTSELYRAAVRTHVDYGSVPLADLQDPDITGERLP